MEATQIIKLNGNVRTVSGKISGIGQIKLRSSGRTNLLGRLIKGWQHGWHDPSPDDPFKHERPSICIRDAGRREIDVQQFLSGITSDKRSPVEAQRDSQRRGRRRAWPHRRPSPGHVQRNDQSDIATRVPSKVSVCLHAGRARPLRPRNTATTGTDARGSSAESHR
jgi:hypothetical protein